VRSLRWLPRYDGTVEMFCTAVHPDSKSAIFATKRDFLCFCAALGFDEGRKVALTEGPFKDLDGRVFEGSQDTIDFLYLLALSEARSSDVLLQESEEAVLSIFEQYANGGLDVIGEWIRESPEDPRGDKTILKGLEKKGLMQPLSVDVGNLPPLF